MNLMLPSARRKDGEKQPCIKIWKFDLRIPFVHYEWEIPEMVQALVVFMTGSAATAYLQDLFGFTFEIALSIVFVHELLYIVNNTLGDPLIGGWITPAVPLITAFLLNYEPGPDRAYALDVDNTLYNRGRDALSDQRYEQEYADKRADVGREWAYKERQDQEARDKALADLLASGGNYSGYGFLGLSPEDAAALGALWSEDRDYAKRDADLDLISKQLGIDLTRKQIANYGKDAYRRTEDTPTPPKPREPKEEMTPSTYSSFKGQVTNMLRNGSQATAVALIKKNESVLSDDAFNELEKLFEQYGYELE